MHTLISLLPVYALGNVHCLGMCGPLVIVIGQHRYRSAYLLGRILSFSLAGAIAGMTGSWLHWACAEMHFSAFLSFAFALIILAYGSAQSFSSIIPPLIGRNWLNWLDRLSRSIAQLMLTDRFSSIFLFGFSTILLPCGQTLMVLSASALMGGLALGSLNSCIFALMTTPSLWLSMHSLKKLQTFKPAKQVLTVLSLIVSLMFMLRGLAEMDAIGHLSFHLFGQDWLHIVVY